MSCYPNSSHARKRRAQRILTEFLSLQGFKNNNIAVLSGPEPQEAIRIYKEFNIFSNCLLVEFDKEIYKEASKAIPENSILIYDDIFNVIKENKSILTGIDLDFCKTFSYEKAGKIIQAINQLEQEKIWLRITTSFRGQSKTKLEQVKFNTLFFVHDNKYKVIHEHNISYRDTSAMNTWQIVLKKNEPSTNSSSNKESRTKSL
jgi:hypothetical protein